MVIKLSLYSFSNIMELLFKMEYFLFVILVICAARCDESNNEIPQTTEEPTQTRSSRQPLQVYWNVPTGKKCNNFENLYEKFGIIQNSNDTFAGNEITILYDPGSFPALLQNTSTGSYVFRNGGLPQEGNWELHEEEFRRTVNESIPDPNFNGIAIIDFESWRPVFRQNFGKLSPYKDYSYKAERKKHPFWPPSWIESEAKQRFEAGARLFMESTLTLAKQLRPNGLWGYYGFPYCFNMQNKPLMAKCADGVPRENDGINWLWTDSTALFPSVYSSTSLSSYQLSQLVQYRIKEAARVRKNGTPILPYFWYRYRDGGFFREADLTAFLKTVYNSPASGFIIWGSYKDVNTPDKCKSLHNYLENVMGPAIAKYTKANKQNDEELDMSNEIDQYDPLYENTTPLIQTTVGISSEEFQSSEESISSGELKEDEKTDSSTTKPQTQVTQPNVEIPENDSWLYKKQVQIIELPQDVKKSDEKENKNENGDEPSTQAYKQLEVYWNVPTGKKCKNFNNLYEKYGIIQNTNDTFEGDKFTILYDPGSFPALLHNEKTNETLFRNGGLPQEGSWDIHEMEFRRAVDERIPDPNFDGVAIIDFESWRPIFRQHWGTLTQYKDYSYKLEKQKHPEWNSTEVETEAKDRFESSAQLFMESTLVMAKELRPNALWGYYGFPYCFNMQSPSLIPECSDTVMKENDRLLWLWDESTVLTPSVYSSKTLTSNELSQLIENRVKETVRVRRNEAPILPYFWYLYRDGGFLSEEDLATFLNTIYNSPASGFIIWGSYYDVNNKEKCASLLEYLENVMGPAIAKYTKTNKQYDEDDDSSNEINHTLQKANNNTTTEIPIKISEETNSRLFNKELKNDTKTKSSLENLVPDLSYDYSTKKFTEDSMNPFNSEFENETDTFTLKPEVIHIFDFIINAFSDNSSENVTVNDDETSEKTSNYTNFKEEIQSTSEIGTEVTNSNSSLKTSTDELRSFDNKNIENTRQTTDCTKETSDSSSTYIQVNDIVVTESYRLEDLTSTIDANSHSTEKFEAKTDLKSIVYEEPDGITEVDVKNNTTTLDIKLINSGEETATANKTS